MSKLTEARHALENNPGVIVAHISGLEYNPTKDKPNHYPCFWVAPKDALYRVNQLQRFMDSLFPQGPEPDFFHQFGRGDIYLNFGRLGFEDMIGEIHKPVTFRLFEEGSSVPDGFVHEEGTEGAKGPLVRTDECKDDITRTTMVRVYPSYTIAANAVEGRCSVAKDYMHLIDLENYEKGPGWFGIRRKYRERTPGEELVLWEEF